MVRWKGDMRRWQKNANIARRWEDGGKMDKWQEGGKMAVK